MYVLDSLLYRKSKIDESSKLCGDMTNLYLWFLRNRGWHNFPSGINHPTFPCTLYVKQTTTWNKLVLNMVWKHVTTTDVHLLLKDDKLTSEKTNELELKREAHCAIMNDAYLTLVYDMCFSSSSIWSIMCNVQNVRWEVPGELSGIIHYWRVWLMQTNTFV